MVNVLDWPLLAAGDIDDDTTLYGIQDPTGVPTDARLQALALAQSSPFADLYATLAGLTAYVSHAELEANTGPNYQAPERKQSYLSRQVTMALARATTQPICELWIGDSFGITGATTPGTSDMLSVYETQMVGAYNPLTRGSGYVPTDMWTPLGTEWSWDTIPAGQHTDRGPQFSNKRINAAQSASHSGSGSDVTVFYTASSGTGGATVGAVVNVVINGASVGTIDSRDAGLPAGTYDSGRSVTFARPTTGVELTGDIDLTLTHSGTGTSFEVEGAYFHGDNDTTGYRLHRGDLPGNALDYCADAVTGLPLLQFIANVQPSIITIMLGVNDAAPTGLNRTAAQLAADLSTLVAAIRAEYSNANIPAIRYLFQLDNIFVPASWPTTYRDAMRAQCVTDGVLFIDTSQLTGTLRGGDPLDVSNDTLHPNDFGSRAIGQSLADLTVRAFNPRRRLLNLATTAPQQVSLAGLILQNAVGPSLAVVRDEGSATDNNDSLGAFTFGGADDAYGGIELAAGMSGVAEEAWTSANHGAGLRWLTNPTGGGAIAIRMGLEGDGDWWLGATAGAATTHISAGLARFADPVQVGNTGLATAVSASGGLDIVTGLFQRRIGVLTLANGINNDIPTPTTPMVIVSGPTGAFSIGGFVVPTNPDGISFRILNVTGFAMTLTLEEPTEATATRRLWSISAAGSRTDDGQGMGELTYVTNAAAGAAQNRWFITEFFG